MHFSEATNDHFAIVGIPSAAIASYLSLEQMEYRSPIVCARYPFSSFTSTFTICHATFAIIVIAISII